MNGTFRQRRGSGNHITRAEGPVCAGHWFTLDGALNNAATPIWLNLRKGRQFANAIGLYITGFAHALCLHITRLADGL
ncbi:MAG: hypothetical protein AAGI28_08885, partial [Pseudomonadota bacterium]